jgi:hypothetical protein
MQAKSMMSLAESKGVKLLLPTDVVVADKFDADAESKVCHRKRVCEVTRVKTMYESQQYVPSPILSKLLLQRRQ